MSDKIQDFFKAFSDAEDSMEVRTASDGIGEKPQAISTGSPSLDDALGIVRGRITQLYGAPGSGKTAMSILLIKEAQKEDPTSRQLYIDAEGTFSPTWARDLGADPSRITLIQDDLAVSAKRLFEMLTGVPKEDNKHFFAGKSKRGFLDEVADGNLNFNLIILDSVGALQVPQEQISEIGKINISPLPRFLSTALKKLSLEVKKANVAMVMINHVRSTMNAYGPDHASAGGNSYHHFLSANIYFEMVARKDAQILNAKEEKIGHTIRATVEKNKFGIWPQKTEFKIDFTSGVHNAFEEIGNLAIKYDIVERPTSMSYVYGDYKWVGAGKFMEALVEVPGLSDELMTKIVAIRDAKYFSIKPTDDKSSAKVVEKIKKSDKSSKSEAV
jgi:recombination protein RecA